MFVGRHRPKGRGKRKKRKKRKREDDAVAAEKLEKERKKNLFALGFYGMVNLKRRPHVSREGGQKALASVQLPASSLRTRNVVFIVTAQKFFLLFFLGFFSPPFFSLSNPWVQIN